MNAVKFQIAACELKVAVVEFLDGMIHTTSDADVISEVVTTLSYPDAVRIRLLYTQVWLSLTTWLSLQGQIFKLLPKLHLLPEPVIPKVIRVATTTFRLFKLLQDKDTTNNRELSAILAESEKLSGTRIGCVEVLNDHQLMAIYFPIPREFRSLARSGAKDEQAFEEVRGINKCETLVLTQSVLVSRKW